MKLQEAILSKKPFKIPTMREYLYVKENNNTPLEDFLFWHNDNTRCGAIPLSALLSDKWELMVVPDNVLEFPIKPIPPGRPKGAA